MAGDWIKVRISLADDPAVIEIAQETGLTEDHVVGKLVRLWGWASTQTENGQAPRVTGLWVNKFLGVEKFAESMISAGWLTVTDDGLKLPRFQRHNSKTAKKRAQDRIRAQRYRARKRHADAVTNVTPREEKRRDTDTGVPVSGRPRKADPLSDAWKALFYSEGVPRSDGSKFGREVATLRELHAKPEDLQRRAENYTTHFDGAALTAAALVKHWQLCAKPKGGGRTATPLFQEILDDAR